MVKKIVFLLFIAFIQNVACAQQAALDTVLAVMDTVATEEGKLHVLLNATTSYRDQAPDYYKFFALYGIAESSRRKSDTYKTLFYKELGIYYRRRNQLDSALHHYNLAKDIALAAEDRTNFIRLKVSIANVLKAQGEYEKAIQYFSEVIDFAERNNKNEQQVITYVNLGALYLAMKESEKAEQVFLKALTIESKVSKTAQPKIYNNLVVVYLNLDKVDEALKYAQKAEQLITGKRSLANLSINKGIIYEKQKEYTLANQSYTDALDYYKELDSETGIIKSYNNLAKLALIQNNISQAGEYLQVSDTLVQKSKDISYKSYFYDTQVQYFMAKKEYKNALQATQKRNAIQDSILNLEKQNAIADIEIKYETERVKREKNLAEKQVVISQLESTKNKNLFIGAAVIAILIFLSSLFFIGQFKAKKKAELITIELKETQKRLALEKQYRDSELKALKAQMNPHFIFNALNSIQEYIFLNKKELAGNYLGKFADLMRKYLHHSDTGYITLQEEVDSLVMYLDLEALRFEDTLEYKISIDSEIISDFIKIPTMLIQPYVENALKHGLLHREKDRKLKVTFLPESQRSIRCTIVDNGIGREASEQLKAKRSMFHKSFATKANEDRLGLFNYRKEHKIGVDIIDLKDASGIATGTQVDLKIPILKT